MSQGQSPPTSPPRVKGDLERRRSRSAENVDLMFQESRRSSSASHSSELKVAKLVDGYLQKIAKDENLALSKFIAIAEAIPEFSCRRAQLIAKPNFSYVFRVWIQSSWRRSLRKSVSSFCSEKLLWCHLCLSGREDKISQILDKLLGLCFLILY